MVSEGMVLEGLMSEEPVPEGSVPKEMVREESDVVLMQDMLVHAKTVIVDALLGGNGGHVEVAKARSSPAAGGEASTSVP
jgi:hypothetical protein